MSNPLHRHPTLGFFIHSQNPLFFRFFRTSQVFPITSHHLRRCHTVTTSHYCQSESSTHSTTRFFHSQSKPLIFSLFSNFPGVSLRFPPPPPPSHCVAVTMGHPNRAPLPGAWHPRLECEHTFLWLPAARLPRHSNTHPSLTPNVKWSGFL
jgi:hypothetical protein